MSLSTPGEKFEFLIVTWRVGKMLIHEFWRAVGVPLGVQEAPDACCATDEVVQIFVCCVTFVLSVGLLFFNAELVFLRPCLFQRLVRKFSFQLLISKVKQLKPRVLAYMWVSVWVSRCAGVRVWWCLGVLFLFILVCLCLPACLGRLLALGACRAWVLASLPWVPACLPCVPACRPRVPAGLGCLYAYLDQTELVVVFLFSSVGVGSVPPRIRVGSRIGHSHSEMEGSRPAAHALSRDRRADGDVRWPGGPARDEGSDTSCWRKLRVLTPHESEES